MKIQSEKNQKMHYRTVEHCVNAYGGRATLSSTWMSVRELIQYHIMHIGCWNIFIFAV